MKKDPNLPHELASKKHEQKTEERLKKDEDIMPVDEVPIEELKKENADEKNKKKSKNNSTSEERLRP